MFGINEDEAQSADFLHDDGTSRNSSILLVNVADRDVRSILHIKLNIIGYFCKNLTQKR